MPNRKSEEAVVLTPPAQVMEGDGKGVEEGLLVKQGRKFFAFERVEYPDEGGILVYYKGMRFPKKGFPTPEAVRANDVLKRIYTAMFAIVGSKDVALPAIGFALLPWKIKQRVIRRAVFNVNRIGDWMLRGYFLKPERYCNAARSTRLFVKYFLGEIGVPEKDADEFAKITATVFEYDDAYRYRLQDIMTEANRAEILQEPRREISRLMDIYSARETDGRVRETFNAVRRLVLLALRHKKIRQAFSRAMAMLADKEFKMFELDNSDRYQVLIRGDYNFLGLPFESNNPQNTNTRRNIWIDAHTFSKCCDAPVVEKRYPIVLHDDGKAERNGWLTTCKKCGNECGWVQRFPVEIEVT